MYSVYLEDDQMSDRRDVNVQNMHTDQKYKQHGCTTISWQHYIYFVLSLLTYQETGSFSRLSCDRIKRLFKIYFKKNIG